MTAAIAALRVADRAQRCLHEVVLTDECVGAGAKPKRGGLEPLEATPAGEIGAATGRGKLRVGVESAAMARRDVQFQRRGAGQNPVPQGEVARREEPPRVSAFKEVDDAELGKCAYPPEVESGAACTQLGLGERLYRVRHTVVARAPTDDLERLARHVDQPTLVGGAQRVGCDLTCSVQPALAQRDLSPKRGDAGPDTRILVCPRGPQMNRG
jgi:hypothetical protein